MSQTHTEASTKDKSHDSLVNERMRASPLICPIKLPRCSVSRTNERSAHLRLTRPPQDWTEQSSLNLWKKKKKKKETRRNSHDDNSLSRSRSRSLFVRARVRAQVARVPKSLFPADSSTLICAHARADTRRESKKWERSASPNGEDEHCQDWIGPTAQHEVGGKSQNSAVQLCSPLSVCTFKSLFTRVQSVCLLHSWRPCTAGPPRPVQHFFPFGPVDRAYPPTPHPLSASASANNGPSPCRKKRESLLPNLFWQAFPLKSPSFSDSAKQTESWSRRWRTSSPSPPVSLCRSFFLSGRAHPLATDKIEETFSTPIYPEPRKKKEDSISPRIPECSSGVCQKNCQICLDGPVQKPPGSSWTWCRDRSVGVDSSSCWTIFEPLTVRRRRRRHRRRRCRRRRLPIF